MSFPAGNSIVEDLGDGHFALYAHLKADSLKVKRGDRVKRGDVIAQMGNTGNSTGPHLHLHIMNSPRILESDGLPYVFDSFTILREVADMNALDDDMAVKKPAVVKDSKFAGKHAHRLMREGQIVQFSE